METATHTAARSYRVERWLAVLLSLLFLLPFVAKADDVLHTGSFHGEELTYRDGEKFLALTETSALVPVTIGVAREHDELIDIEGEETGKRVSVPGMEHTLLVRGARLHPGPVARATPDAADLYPAARNAAFTLGGKQYTLAYRCTAADCTLVLRSGGVSQDLVTIDADAEVGHAVNFAGDLDGDGRLDLIANLSTHYNVGHMKLYLSSAAKQGQLVALTAEFAQSGC